MRFKLLASVALAATTSLALAISPTRATTIVRHSVEEMTNLSDDVVEGTVASAESRWTDDHQQILTYVTVTSATRLKGQGSGDLTFVQLGGMVGGDFMVALGAPSFVVGEHVVVFLGHMVSDKRLAFATDRWLLGLGQGKWSVTTDRATGRSSARVAVEGARIIERPGRPIENELDIDQLRARVRAAANLR